MLGLVLGGKREDEKESHCMPGVMLDAKSVASPWTFTQPMQKVELPFFCREGHTGAESLGNAPKRTPLHS